MGQSSQGSSETSMTGGKNTLVWDLVSKKYPCYTSFSKSNYTWSELPVFRTDEKHQFSYLWGRLHLGVHKHSPGRPRGGVGAGTGPSLPSLGPPGLDENAACER